MKKKLLFLRDFFVIFSLVFSFYVVSFLQISLVMGGICLFFLLSNYKKLQKTLALFCSQLGKCILFFSLYIFFNCLIFSLIHGTLDLSYFIPMLTLFTKLLCVFFCVNVLQTSNYHPELSHYEKIIVYIFVLQSIIQLLAFVSKPLATILLYFNHAEELQEGSGGMRGIALSGGTGWPLGLSYGVAFIFYTKVFLIDQTRLHFKDVLIGILLLVGVFFSGRSAYTGILVSFAYFCFFPGKKIRKKIIIFLEFIFYLSIIILLFLLFFTDFVSLLFSEVFPWAFEFFFKAAEGKGLQTGSTNVLLDMWKKYSLITPVSFFIGEGYFTDPFSGKYYNRVDVGYLRNIFYWGIMGTVVVYIYQIFIFLPILLSRDRKTKIFVWWILVYLFVLEAKAMTVTFTHFTMIICVLYVLLYQQSNQSHRLVG